MQVFLVMGNDFPAAAFSTWTLAERYCELRKGHDKKNGARIHWRWHAFQLDCDTRDQENLGAT